MSARDEVPIALLGIADVQRPAAGATAAAAVVRVSAVGGDAVWVASAAGAPPLPARSLVELTDDDVDAEVLVVHDGGDPQRPVIVGRLRATPGGARMPVAIEADGERVVVSAREQLVLQCGEASITLTRSGKVLIRGHYVQSRATGVNAVKGGSVELN